MKKHTQNIIILLLLVTFGCKSSKSIIAKGELNDKLSVKQIIRENQKQSAKFKTLQGKVKINYTEGDKSQTHTVNLRIEKDKTIWLSAAFNMARVMITPESVQFYDKINNQFFDGDYTLLSELLGIDLDFYKVQNLLLGESIFNLKDKPYIASTFENSYTLQPKNQEALFELFLLLNPNHFKLDSLQIFQPQKKRMLQVDYSEYQDVDKQILPRHIRIVAAENTEQVAIALEFKSIRLNSEVRFPFRIPSGFKEIALR